MEISNIKKVTIVNTSLVWDKETKKLTTEGKSKAYCVWAIGVLGDNGEHALLAEVWNGMTCETGDNAKFVARNMKRSLAIVLAHELAVENGWGETKTVRDDYAACKEIVDGEKREKDEKDAKRKAEKRSGAYALRKIAELAQSGVKQCESTYASACLSRIGAQAASCADTIGDMTAEEFDAMCAEQAAAKKASSKKAA